MFITPLLKKYRKIDPMATQMAQPDHGIDGHCPHFVDFTFYIHRNFFALPGGRLLFFKFSDSKWLPWCDLGIAIKPGPTAFQPF